MTCLLGLAALVWSCRGLEMPPSSAENQAPEWMPEGGYNWVKAEDVETRELFRRNYGLGYSYNAVRWDYCNWKDIRCQVLNRYFLENMQAASGEILMAENTARESSVASEFSYSFRDYVANVAVETKQKIDLGLYKNEKRNRQYFLENGIQESFYYTLEEKELMVDSYINYASVLARYSRNRNVFTQSFRNAVEHLRLTPDDNVAAVDSMIKVWGTHVIVSASLGGRLRVDLMNSMWRYNDRASEEAWSTQEFLKAVENKQKSRVEEEFVWLKDCRLKLQAWGGDQSFLTGLLGEHKPDGTRTFSLDGISAWRRSLVYNPADELNSNVELIDMAVVPIWEFAAVVDKWQAMRIKAAITQDAALMQKLLGDANFFNAAFPIRYPSASCQWRKDTATWETFTRVDADDTPQVVNIESGGRYVATVCHEQIDGHDLWVCYPIYEGKVKMACGLGVEENNSVFKVRWIGDTPTLTYQAGVTAGDTFYITAGGVGVESVEDVVYAPGRALPYIELSGGVRSDGSYASRPFSVFREEGHFVMPVQASARPENIVGWDTYTTVAADRWIFSRNPDYTYIYNANEIR